MLHDLQGWVRTENMASTSSIFEPDLCLVRKPVSRGKGHTEKSRGIQSTARINHQTSEYMSLQMMAVAIL